MQPAPVMVRAHTNRRGVVDVTLENGADGRAATEGRRMHIDPRFQQVANRFFECFRSTANGGGAAAAYLHGEPILDVWAGWRSKDQRWTHDTVTLCFSTGKGVASTVLHRLADRGLV